MVYSLIFFALAAACNSVMDAITHHYYTSIFFGLDFKFWNPAFSWKFAKFIPYTKFRIDAWHLFKSAMIVFFVLSLIFYYFGMSEFVPYPDGFKVKSIVLLSTLVVYGLVWNGVFNLFYNHLLVKKKV